MTVPSAQNPFVPGEDLPFAEYDQPDLVTTMILMRKYRKALEDIISTYAEYGVSPVGSDLMHRIAREAL